MGRKSIWTEITEALRGEIAEGRYAPGDKLPTEAHLATRFGVNRHTIRRAIAALHEDGLTHSRRGAGVFVAARPTLYRVGRRTRFHENLASAGQSADKAISRLETAPASAAEAAALALAPGDPIHIWEGVGLADGAPILLFHAVFPAARLPGLLRHLGETHSVTRSLAAVGVADYTRASTELTAELASATQAMRLNLRAGAPLLHTVSVNIDPAGAPVEYGRTWWAGERVRLSVDMPRG